MRLILLLLICLADAAFSYYSRKTRFDRSIHDDLENVGRDELIKKQWTFTDDQTLFIAHKDRHDNACYLEKLDDDRTVNSDNTLQSERKKPKLLYVPNETLTKLEAWRIAGGRIVDFCRGLRIYQLQENVPIAGGTVDPFMNELPRDENDIATRRVADIVLEPLLTRTRRDIILETREKLNKQHETIRVRRQAAPYNRGRFRGQTQSQYLNMGNDGQSEGKAEAEATQQSSRAVVAGNRGMGQAQSMSSSGSGCEDCPGYNPDYSVHVDQVPGKLQVQGAGKDGRYASIPGTMVPGGGYPGGVVPGTTVSGGTVSGKPTYPGGVQQPGERYPSVVVGPESMIPGHYPGGVVPGSGGPTAGGVYPGGSGVFVPGSVVTYPGGVVTGPKTTGSGVQYPGGTVTGTTVTGTGGGYPSGAPTGTGVGYPSGVPTGAGTGGGYPSGVPTGAGTTGTRGGYPSGLPTGTGGGYPSEVPTGAGTTATGGGYPSGVPMGTGTGGGYPSVPTDTGTTGTVVRYPSGVPTGTGVTGGSVSYPGGVVPGSVPTGGSVMYPTAVATGTATVGSGVTYPGGVIPGVATGGGIVYPRVYPTGSGTVTTEGGGPYPGVFIPGTYQVGVGGGTVNQGVAPEAIRRPGEGYPAGVSYPPGTIPGRMTYPSGVVPGVTTIGGTGAAYPIATGGTGTYPPGVPGTIVTGGGTYPTTNGKTVAPTGILPNIVTSAKTDTGTSISFPGGGPYPPEQIPPGRPTATNIPTGMVQPGITGFLTPGAMYPGTSVPEGGLGQVTYPSGPGYPVYPNGGVQPGQYPLSGIPGIVQYPPGQYPPVQQYPANQFYQGGSGGQVPVPGQGVQGKYPSRYPGGVDGGVLEPSKYYQQPKHTSSAEDDGSDSQALSSVKQVDSGTEASASAQGKYGQGTAQSQVSGIYSGTASFSAQAGTSDINRSAQAEISGGKNGAISNAEGVGGRGKSQAQVQLNSDSGSTSTGAQSSGWNHGTNSQVQASSKGGLADAQANGEGSTSSQAQIGFQPYLKDDDKVERRSTPFRGGGTASAQSGTHRGQSQSQLQGSFQYGITYTGAAQAGSGSGATASRKPFNFSLTNNDLHKPKTLFNKLDNTPLIPTDEAADVTPTPTDVDFNRIQKQRQGLMGSSSYRQTVVASTAKEQVETTMAKERSVEDTRAKEPVYNDNDYVYDYEDDYDSPVASSSLANSDTSSSSSASSRKESENQHQSQTIQVGNANRYDVQVTQDSNIPREGDRLQPGQSLPGYTIPPGFTGRVMSVAGDDTIAQGDGKSQSQTVALLPKEPNATRENKSAGSESRSQHNNNHARLASTYASRSSDDYFNSHTRSASNSFLTRDLDRTVRPTYYTVTNSVTGKIDDNKNSQKKYEHRYYTKSSTCGYFTFSCNIVYGSNGRTKICKPKVPTYPDGTPMKC